MAKQAGTGERAYYLRSRASYFRMVMVFATSLLFESLAQTISFSN